MTTKTNAATIILIPGFWLGAWAWDEVVERLRHLNRHVVAMTLPGLDEADAERASRTLDDQATAIEHVVRQEGQPVVLVAHSGASAPVSMVLDRVPELISRVIWVDSGPAVSGSAFDADLSDDVTERPLPQFDVLAEDASLEGLGADVLERFRSRALAEPAPVLRERVVLQNDARHRVPTTLVCCSLPSTQIMQLADAGHTMFADVAALQSLELIDLPTGHWPMWSRPAELAEIIATAR